MPADQSFTLSSIPATMTWKNQPSESTSDAGQQISITAGADTDWFIGPAGEHVKSNAPIALFTPPDQTFCLQARVTVSLLPPMMPGPCLSTHRMRSGLSCVSNTRPSNSR